MQIGKEIYVGPARPERIRVSGLKRGSGVFDGKIGLRVSQIGERDSGGGDRDDTGVTEAGIEANGRLSNSCRSFVFSLGGFICKIMLQGSTTQGTKSVLDEIPRIYSLVQSPTRISFGNGTSLISQPPH